MICSGLDRRRRTTWICCCCCYRCCVETEGKSQSGGRQLPLLPFRRGRRRPNPPRGSISGRVGSSSLLPCGGAWSGKPAYHKRERAENQFVTNMNRHVTTKPKMTQEKAAAAAAAAATTTTTTPFEILGNTTQSLSPGCGAPPSLPPSQPRNKQTHLDALNPVPEVAVLAVATDDADRLQHVDDVVNAAALHPQSFRHQVQRKVVWLFFAVLQ